MAFKLGLTEVAAVANRAVALAVPAFTVAAAILRAERDAAVVPTVARITLTNAVGTLSMFAAVVGASCNGAILASPSGVAETHSFVTLPFAGATIGTLAQTAIEVSVSNVTLAFVVNAVTVPRTFVDAAQSLHLMSFGLILRSRRRHSPILLRL